MSFEPLLYFFAFVIVPMKNKERERKETVEERRKKRRMGKREWGEGGESAFIQHQMYQLLGKSYLT